MLSGAIIRAVLAGSLVHDRLRTVLAIMAIALGVALGFAVQTINRAAVNELSLGVQALSGDADLEVRGPRGGFDEALYPVLAQRPEVAVASPVVEIDAKLADRPSSLRILGVDPFRAALIQPALIPTTTSPLEMLQPDAIFLSTAAAQLLGQSPGDTIVFQAGLRTVSLRVAGTLNPGLSPTVAVIDIAGAQTQFDSVGRLTRIDLRLRSGVDSAGFVRAMKPALPAGVAMARPEATVVAGTSLSRAYRVNLNVLALVALFTGGLLVFSTQALSVVRRRSQLALLRVLGLRRRRLIELIVLEGAVQGLVGSALGLLAGYGLAYFALRVFGADLGSGYFRGVAPTLTLDPVALGTFFVLGVATAVSGSALPALEAARTAPAQALKAGDEQRAFTHLRPWTSGLGVLAAGGIAAFGPPVSGLPLFGYASIALLLIGTLMLLPRLAEFAWGRWPTPRSPAPRLALAQLRGAPGQAMVSLASIVASVSLMVSMGIMVTSFRGSLETWLEQVLPADLYVRAAMNGDSAYLPLGVQDRIRALAGVRRADFMREQQLLLDPDRPRVVLIARDIDPTDPGRTLPLVSPSVTVAAEAPPPVWINEPAAALYGQAVGQRIELPLGGRAVAFTVAGIWRDYARAQGAFVIGRERYIAATEDHAATNAAIWLAPGADPAAMRDILKRDIPGGERLEVAAPGEIRALSLRAFDRTFAVTYALELAAVLIGLVGLSSAFGALVLARRREFGMLRHLGMTRGQIGGMLASEGFLVSGVGMATGLGLGWLMSLVLIHVVNRQSFHWGMEVAIPWWPLLGAVVLALGLAMVTAVWSGRVAMGVDAVRAVRDDW